MPESSNTVKINRDKSPVFIIEFEDAPQTPPMRLDPLKVILDLKKANIEVQAVDPADLQRALATWKNVIGLPSLADSDAMSIFFAFQKYLEELQKKTPWLQSAPPSMELTPAQTTPPNTASDSSSTATAAAPLP